MQNEGVFTYKCHEYWLYDDTVIAIETTYPLVYYAEHALKIWLFIAYENVLANVTVVHLMKFAHAAYLAIA